MLLMNTNSTFYKHYSEKIKVHNFISGTVKGENHTNDFSMQIKCATFVGGMFCVKS